jgi:carbonic anhydrase/acetyltransferase-like protein (isoleucine patch superfamily)
MSDLKHGTRAVGDWPARLRLHPTAFIAPGAVVVGDVRLGARSSVWFNAVLRGDVDRIEVGEDSNIQDASVVHMDEGSPALIGARVTIGHGAVIHGCVIEDDCLIGMGAVVLTGALIGAGSLIGAGALVREKQSIAPGSIALGMPAKAAGQVTEAHRAGMRRGWEHYVALGRSYVERGFAGPHPSAGSGQGQTAHQRGPMSFLEWGQLLTVLAESCDWMADRIERDAEGLWRERPAPGRWSALEALCHLRDADRDIFLPRLGRMLAERNPEFPDVDMTGWESARGYNGQSPAAVLEEWAEVRRALLGRLAPLTRADWVRVGIHALRGPYPLAEMVRTWADHDLSHRRQIAEALGEFA